MIERSEDVTEHIDLAASRMRKIFQSVSNKIEERMKVVAVGSKLCNVTALAVEIGKEFDCSGPEMYPFVKAILEGYPNIECKRGAKGGIYHT